MVSMSDLFNSAGRQAQVSVSVGYGKALLSKQNLVLTCFSVEPEFKRELLSKRYVRMGATDRIPVSPYPDIDGFLYSERVSVPEGAIVCLQGSRRHRGVPIADSALFIRVREEGPLYVISAHLPPGGRIATHPVFIGNGDIIGLDELAVAGITPNRNYVSSFMNEEELGEVFAVQKAAEGKTPAPRLEMVVNSEGEAIALNTAVPSRRMRVRR